MTKELEILKAAEYHYDKSLKWFGYYEETNSQSCWQVSIEEDMKTRGLLEAYNIIAETHILPHEIKKEIARLETA